MLQLKIDTQVTYTQVTYKRVRRGKTSLPLPLPQKGKMKANLRRKIGASIIMYQISFVNRGRGTACGCSAVHMPGVQ